MTMPGSAQESLPPTPSGDHATMPRMLSRLVLETFPGSTADIDRPLHDDGEWWIDVQLGGRGIPVSWKHDRGFGLYHETEGFGGGPDELVAEPGTVVLRLQQIHAAREITATLSEDAPE